MPAGAGAAFLFGPVDTWVAGGKPLAIGAEHITGGASTGFLDVVTANFDTDSISIYDGPFFQPGLGDPPPNQQTAGDGPSSLAMGQFSPTFPADIAIANANADTVLVRFGSSIRFLSVDERTYPVGNEPVSVAVGQFSGAGAAQRDLVVANASDDTVSVLLADPSGFFGPHTTFPVGDRPVSVTQEDFDQDGNRDLAVANFNSNTLSVLMGNGNGTFQAQQTYAVGFRPSAVVMGDFNPWQDGHWDIAVANSLDNTVSVLLGNGDGTFQAQDVYPVSTGPSALTVGLRRGRQERSRGRQPGFGQGLGAAGEPRRDLPPPPDVYHRQRAGGAADGERGGQRQARHRGRHLRRQHRVRVDQRLNSAAAAAGPDDHGGDRDDLDLGVVEFDDQPAGVAHLLQVRVRPDDVVRVGDRPVRCRLGVGSGRAAAALDHGVAVGADLLLPRVRAQ